jgi:hypothetical protein
MRQHLLLSDGGAQGAGRQSSQRDCATWSLAVFSAILVSSEAFGIKFLEVGHFVFPFGRRAAATILSFSADPQVRSPNLMRVGSPRPRLNATIDIEAAIDVRLASHRRTLPPRR